MADEDLIESINWGFTKGEGISFRMTLSQRKVLVKYLQEQSVLSSILYSYLLVRAELHIFLGTVLEFPLCKEEAIWDYSGLYLKQDAETIYFEHHFSSSSQSNCFKGLCSLFFFFLFWVFVGSYKCGWTCIQIGWELKEEVWFSCMDDSSNVPLGAWLDRNCSFMGA